MRSVVPWFEDALLPQYPDKLAIIEGSMLSVNEEYKSISSSSSSKIITLNIQYK